MTRERAKELLPVLQAWAEGKEVQVTLAGTEEWNNYGQPSPLIDPNFENPKWKWRVKPEAREWWVAFYSLGRRDWYKTEQDCKADAFSCEPYPEEIIHVKEVL